jgi:hypothetical protein
VYPFDDAHDPKEKLFNKACSQPCQRLPGTYHSRGSTTSQTDNKYFAGKVSITPCLKRFIFRWRKT